MKLLTPVADALCRAHRLPTSEGVVTIVHRDLKPENIFLAHVGTNVVPKVLDFGIARISNVDEQRMTLLQSHRDMSRQAALVRPDSSEDKTMEGRGELHAAVVQVAASP